jgi:UDP-N-acetylmuramate dehydrogenase
LSDADARVRVRAEAGVVWDTFVEWCVEHGLWGVENLSGIPGTVGAAPVQNIGAYGSEVGDMIESVEMFIPEEGKFRTMSGKECGFGYRDSIFKSRLRGKIVVTAVNFILGRSAAPQLGYGGLRDEVAQRGEPTLANIRHAVIAIRDSKLPDPKVIGNAGSFFKNPSVADSVARALKDIYPDMPLYPSEHEGYAKLAAGWLIDRAGWKGRRVGNAGVHDKQALVLVNYGSATGSEILEVARMVQRSVKEQFGIEIEPEVNIF